MLPRAVRVIAPRRGVATVLGARPVQALRPVAALHQSNGLMPARRPYSTEENAGSGKSNRLLYTAAVSIACFAGGFYYQYNKTQGAKEEAAPKRELNEKFYQDVYNAVAAILDNNEYDDGSYGPVLVRLAWHAAGTYDKNTGTGGSNGATMRFSPESDHGANAGLKVARDLLEPIKKKFPEISYSDLWSLGGVVAIQELGGPVIPWRPGRKDADSATACTPDGRLPDAAKGQDHIRNIFYRMGFNDQEIVALIGAHALGRCHVSRSGFDGPWTRSPITFSNDFYVNLLKEKWSEKKWDGPKQFANKEGDLMMLPADMAFYKDWSFYRHVQAYAKDQDLFFKDFSKAFAKLLELGVPFKEDTPVFHFKTTA